MAFDAKWIKTSDRYKYVQMYRFGKKMMWRGLAGKKGYGKYFSTEREAAIYVDKQLIEQRKEPVNILVSINKSRKDNAV
ncbi:MAG: hypothetical protein GF317_23495 [Candidatus Lokiarchaeota archaeon]|nr:hypothetical protein [Candidatus Lokiarchaeota archaeon]